MEMTCIIQCELPFMLNLPNGTYSVLEENAPYDLEVLQGLVAVHFNDRNFAIDAPETLKRAIGGNFDRFYKQPLRTVLRHRLSVEVGDNNLPEIGEQEMLEDLQAAIIGESPMAFAGKNDELMAEAKRRLATMSDDEKTSFLLRTAKKRFARRLPDHERFLTAVNVLIRLYMEQFKDFFVEEVAVHQLASQAPLMGIHIQVTSDGVLIDNHGVVERLPPVMRQPWLNHPSEQIAEFTTRLRNGTPPDSIALLGIRAKAFFQRGAYRSAIIESSASLDLAISRRIRAGYRKQGKADVDVDSILKTPSNQRFEERAKVLLRDATGKSAAEFDNTLWSNVVSHRAKYRQGVAHADAEPLKTEAERVVEDFLRLTDLVGAIVI